ncbi:hypothetical protein FIBSPDRAFT_867474 [Athelia psychrophila]|uniref:Uncharacterized protein n=1 Tax=Athelia psychrophila TaxID=1759441 RepID=A0A166DY81_9AGAM|nr:hypothetical protein FIBSPDRAFT_867474 [Fibularhizoctonia sp. CBS 109695]
MAFGAGPGAPWISLSLVWRIPQNSATPSSENESRTPSFPSAQTRLLAIAPVSPEATSQTSGLGNGADMAPYANVRPVPPHPTVIFKH